MIDSIPKIEFAKEEIVYITYTTSEKIRSSDWAFSANVSRKAKNEKIKNDYIQDYEVIEINSEIKLTIPFARRFLIPVIEDAKYILELEEGWDDYDAKPYTNDSWRAGVQFLLQFYDWLQTNSKGNLHIPKMHHGPNGTIDLAWHEDNIRLFINIDKMNNKGSFYCDVPGNPKKQYSEGQFTLNNFKFHLIPIPYKF